MDIKLPSQSASTQPGATRVGDLLAQLRAAGSIEAEVIEMLPGKLLLKSRLGEIQTSNTLNFKPGDRLSLRLDTSGREAVLKASPAPRKSILLDRVEIPQLVRLLPAGKPLLASVLRVVARQAEIRVAGQLLRLPPAVDARRGELLSLRRNDNQRQVEVTRLERKTIYKALLKLLVPRDGAGGRESLVKLVELINAGAHHTARAAAAAGRGVPPPTARQPADPEAARHTAQRPAQPGRHSAPQVPAPGAGSAAAANAAPRYNGAQFLAAPGADSAGTARRPAADSGSKTMSAAARTPGGVAANGPQRPPPGSAPPPPGSAKPGTNAAPPAPRQATAERAPLAPESSARAYRQAPRITAKPAPAATPAGSVRGRSPGSLPPQQPGAAAAAARKAAPLTPPRGAGSAPTPEPLTRGEHSAAMPEQSPRSFRGAAVPNPEPPASRPAAAAGSAASSPGAAGALPGARGAIDSAEPVQLLARLAARLPQLDAARIKSWFEAAGLVAPPASRAAAAPSQDIPALLKHLLEPEGLQRELIAAARTRAVAEADSAAPRPGANDALAQLQRDGVRLAEQGLVQNLLQRASLGLQQETQQPLAVNLALPLIEDDLVKPLYIDLAQRNLAEHGDDNCWDIRISFEFSGLGPVACHIVLENLAVAASFYSELAATRTGIENALPELRRQLLDAGFTPGEFHSFAGQLKRAQAPVADDFGEALIDVEV